LKHGGHGDGGGKTTDVDDGGEWEGEWIVEPEFIRYDCRRMD